jgi:hypothetical protein
MFNRVPRADKLTLLRDTLHVLAKLDGITSKSRLLLETEKIMQTPDRYFTDPNSFEDYLTLGVFLSLIQRKENVIILLIKGKELVKLSSLSAPNLSNEEREFLQPLLLGYKPFKRFISDGFHKNSEKDLNQVSVASICLTREELLSRYMDIKGHTTDREARTLLGWSLQAGMVEYDGYSHTYYLIEDRQIETDLFLKELKKSYAEIRDAKTQIALIPALRIKFCCDNRMPREIFDNTLLHLESLMPSIVQLGKASSSREIVRRYGIHGKTFYYYYIKLVVDLI